MNTGWSSPLKSRMMTLPALLTRSVAVVFLALAVLSIALWIASLGLGVIGRFSVGAGTDLRVVRGITQVRHVYEYDFAAPVPKEEWHATAVSNGWVVPQNKQGTIPKLAFSSGHVRGITGTPGSGLDGMVSPARYWLLDVPLWVTMLPGMLVMVRLAMRWEQIRQARRCGLDVMASQVAA